MFATDLWDWVTYLHQKFIINGQYSFVAKECICNQSNSIHPNIFYWTYSEMILVNFFDLQQKLQTNLDSGMRIQRNQGDIWILDLTQVCTLLSCDRVSHLSLPTHFAMPNSFRQSKTNDLPWLPVIVFHRTIWIKFPIRMDWIIDLDRVLKVGFANCMDIHCPTNPSCLFTRWDLLAIFFDH